VEESLSRVETALKLVRVAGIDSQQAVAGLTAAIKGFEGAGLTVAEIGDKLAEVDTKFAVSTEDLINGLERASASARVAGVSFDELLAAVTTVQERTQRGGAVIGNAFKTIFARLGRTDTLVALEQLGIQVLDTQGNVRDAVPLFRELAVRLDDIGLRSTKAGDIIQKVAGVRQRDILINLIEDLNSEQSKFNQALKVSASSVGALDSKNQQLNQTLDALIKNLVTSGQQLASVLGEIGFLDAAKGIVDGFSSVVNAITDILDGEGIGSKFARGLIAGIGSVLTGPGLGLALAIFTKLFIDLAKFGVTSLKSLLGLNAQTERQNALQQSVLQSLMQNEALQASLLKLGNDKAAQEQLLLRVYQQQINAMSRLAAISKTVTPGLYGKGLRGGPGGVTGKASGGYIASERRDVNRGVGGATSAAQVVSIPNFAFGGGKRGTMIANTSEYIVPNYAGGGDAIFNQNMVKSMGLPPGARKITAAGGFIPNFRSIANMTMFDVNRSLKAEKMQNPTSPALRSEKAQLLMRQRQLNAGKKLPGFNADARGIVMLVPQKGIRGASLATRFNKPRTGASGKQYGSFKGKAFGIDPNLRNDSKFNKLVGLDEELDAAMGNAINSIVGKVYPAIKTSPTPPISTKAAKQKFLQEGGEGAFGSFRGAMFEAIIEMIVGGSRKDRAGKLDIKFNEKNRAALTEIFGLPKAYVDGDYKNSIKQKSKFIDQSLMARGAGGYIPNYADPLSDAIGREAAAGVPINQIRINQSGKLRNSANPGGLAVTNTRDEPTGAVPNFVAPLAMAAPFLISTIAATVIPLVVDKTLKFLSTRKGIQKGLGGQTIRRGPAPAPRGLPGGPMGTAGILLSTLAYSAPAFMGAFGEQPMMDDTGESPVKSLQEQLKALEEAGPIMKKVKTGTEQITGGGGRFGSFTRQIFEEILDEEAMADRAKKIAELKEQVKEIKVTTRAATMVEAMTKGEAKSTIITQFGQKRRDIQGTAQLETGGLTLNEAKALLQINKELSEVQKVNLQYEINSAANAEKIKIQKIADLKTLANQAVEGKKLGEIEKERFNNLLESVDANTDYLKFTKQITDLLGETGEYTEEQIQTIVEKALTLKATNEEMGKDLQKNLDLRKDENDAIAEGTDALNERIRAQERFIEASKNSTQLSQLSINLDRAQGQGLVGKDARDLNVDLIRRQASVNRLGTADKFTQLENETMNKLQDLNLATVFGGSEEQMKEIQHLENRLTYLKEAKRLELDIINSKEAYDAKIAGMNPLQEYLYNNQKQIDVFADELPARMAANLEQGLNNVFDKASQGAYDSIGDAFLDIALQFGQQLQREIMANASKQIVQGVFNQASGGGGGGGGGGFLQSVGNFLTNMFTGGGGQGKNAGGLITGGGGVIDDVPAILTGGEYVIKKSAVQKYGVDYLNKLNSGSIQGFNNGGFVSYESTYSDGSNLQGIDNVRTGRFFDDPRGNMFGGAASEARMARARATDFFMPGDRGFGTIVGKENLKAFSEQLITSGSTDMMDFGVSGGSINLEIQSRNLTAFGRRRMSPARERLIEAQKQAYGLAMAEAQEEERVLFEHEEAKRQRDEQLKANIKGAFINATFAAVGAAIGPPGGGELTAGQQATKTAINYAGQSVANMASNPNFQVSREGNTRTASFAQGGLVSAGQQSLLQGGEYVMSRDAVDSVGSEAMESINNMTATTFANGGPVGSVSGMRNNGGGGKADVENINITINIEKDGKSDVETTGSGEEDPTRSKEFGRKIKQLVVDTINEEKRVSGSLFTRNK
jgi:TP901 family phage tail tape measure protein